MKIKITLLAAAFLLAANCLLPTESFATCVASFTWTQTAPNVITFTNTSTGGVNPSYTWNFGDSSTDTTTSPVHTYSAPGSYQVCLHMYDNNVLCDFVCHTITVTGNIPCLMTVSTQATPATCSTCPDGSVSSTVTAGTPPYSYLWSTGATTANISNLPPGLYTVCVTDAHNCTACSTSHVTCCSGGPCHANFTWTQTAPNVITFTNTSTGGNSPTYAWHFGDNTSSTNQNPVHTYSMPGTYWVCLYMFSNNALCDSICDSVTVTGNIPCQMTVSTQATPATCSTCSDGSVTSTVNGGTPPYSYLWSTGATTANINNLPPGLYTVCVTDAHNCTACHTSHVTCCSNVSCHAAFTLHHDSITPHLYWAVNLSTGVPPLSYLWSWGDNTYDTVPYPSHVYAAAGFYTICLTITDSTGCTDSVCHSYQLFRMDAANAMIYVNVVPSLPTDVTQVSSQQDISLYPNPAAKEFRIQDSGFRIQAVEIYDVLGEKRLTPTLSKGEGVTSIDVSELTAGIYFVRILREESLGQTVDFIETKKLIVVK
ncbi:MAG TPA: PKD domain-containing protein [Bacteroidia bacterium]|nr:PKD domain-containing protein [Bacteroidia bacterium]